MTFLKIDQPDPDSRQLLTRNVVIGICQLQSIFDLLQHAWFAAVTHAALSERRSSLQSARTEELPLSISVGD